MFNQLFLSEYTLLAYTMGINLIFRILKPNFFNTLDLAFF